MGALMNLVLLVATALLANGASTAPGHFEGPKANRTDLHGLDALIMDLNMTPKPLVEIRIASANLGDAQLPQDTLYMAVARAGGKVCVTNFSRGPRPRWAWVCNPIAMACNEQIKLEAFALVDGAEFVSLGRTATAVWQSIRLGSYIVTNLGNSSTRSIVFAAQDNSGYATCNEEPYLYF